MLEPEEGLARRARRLRLNTLIGLRWLAVSGQALAIVIGHFGIGLQFPIVACLALVTASAVLNLALRRQFPVSTQFSERGAAILLAYDILQLAGLLFLTGGIANPFAILFLAPVTIAAASLALRETLGLLALTLISASLLTRWSLPLPWIDGQNLVLPTVYVVGLWGALIVSAAFVTLYAYRVAAEARQTATALAATELALARAQHLSQLDGLAAAAAHELSTPLATVALVVHEMASQASSNEGAAEDLRLLEESVDRCRSILGKLSAPAELSSQTLEFSSPVELAEIAAAPHRLLGVSITVEGEGSAPPPKCPQNPGLLYALGNLIENAVGYAETSVVVRANWTKSTVEIVILDDGPGFPPNILARIGEPYLRSEGARRNQGAGGGHGLGLFIASVFIERTGGSLRFANATLPAKGAVVSIAWPRQGYEQGLGGAANPQIWPLRHFLGSVNNYGKRGLPPVIGAGRERRGDAR